MYLAAVNNTNSLRSVHWTYICLGLYTVLLMAVFSVCYLYHLWEVEGGRGLSNDTQGSISVHVPVEGDMKELKKYNKTNYVFN